MHRVLPSMSALELRVCLVRLGLEIASLPYRPQKFQIPGNIFRGAPAGIPRDDGEMGKNESCSSASEMSSSKAMGICRNRCSNGEAERFDLVW